MANNGQVIELYSTLDLIPGVQVREVVSICVELLCKFMFSDSFEQGFPFTFPKGGGMVPPLRGGTQGGGFGSPGGGMARDALTTIN